MKKFFILVFFIILVTSLLVAGYWVWKKYQQIQILPAVLPLLQAPEKPQAVQNYNVLLLTIDASRPDLIGCGGQPEAVSPCLDHIAKNGVLFTEAISHTSWTIPNLISMLTSLYPTVHKVDNRENGLNPAVFTITKILNQKGWKTPCSSYLFLEPHYNLGCEGSAEFPQDAVEDQAFLNWLEGWTQKENKIPSDKNKFFAWIHYHELHLPYNPPPIYEKMFLKDQDHGVTFDAIKKNVIIKKGGQLPLTYKNYIRDLYFGEIRVQDERIGHLIKVLKEKGVLDNTLIIISADHGEELLDHGFVGHASTSLAGTLYDEVIRIPLIFYLPKVLPRNKIITEQVETIDIMPTILEILGIEPSGQGQGQSLLPLINNEILESRKIYTFCETTPCGYNCSSEEEKSRIQAIRSKKWKLIRIYDHFSDSTRYELYDLENDPSETKNLIGQNPEVETDLKNRLENWLQESQKLASSLGWKPELAKTPPTGSIQKSQLPAEIPLLNSKIIILQPQGGQVIKYSLEGNNPVDAEKILQTGQRIQLKWTGASDLQYHIEYEIGVGDYHLKGVLQAQGTTKTFGPLPKDIWESLPLYNPFKIRVVPADYPEFSSEWVTFTFQEL